MKNMLLNFETTYTLKTFIQQMKTYYCYLGNEQGYFMNYSDS